MPAAFAEHEQVTITIQPKGATCEMNDPCFTPNTITVNAGSEVVWHNGDDISRNIVIATLETVLQIWMRVCLMTLKV